MFYLLNDLGNPDRKYASLRSFSQKVSTCLTSVFTDVVYMLIGVLLSVFHLYAPCGALGFQRNLLGYQAYCFFLNLSFVPIKTDIRDVLFSITTEDFVKHRLWDEQLR